MTTQNPNQSEPTLAEVLAALRALEASNKALQQQVDATEAERRKFQAQADREAARRQVPQPVAQPIVQVPGRPGAQNEALVQKLAETEELATRSMRELMMIRETAARGLKAEEVGDVEWNTPQELRLLLDNLVNRKQLNQIQESLKAGGDKPSGLKVDNGGPTEGDLEGAGSEADTAELDKQYQTIRSGSKGDEAFQAMIQLAHRDPRKAYTGTRTGQA